MMTRRDERDEEDFIASRLYAQARGHDSPIYWQMTTTFLGGIVLTLCGVWFTYVRNAVTYSVMADYVQKYSPYALAKDNLEQENKNQDEKMQEIYQNQKAILKEMKDIEIVLAERGMHPSR